MNVTATMRNLSMNEIRVILINLIQRFKSSNAAAMEYIEDLERIGLVSLYRFDPGAGERHYRFVSELNDVGRIKDDMFDYGFSVYQTENGHLVHTKFDELESLYEF